MLNGMRNFAQTFRDRAAATSRPTRARNGAWLAGEQAIMGTAIRVELWSDDVANGEAAIAAVMQEMHRIDAAMSPFKADSAPIAFRMLLTLSPEQVQRARKKLMAALREFQKTCKGGEAPAPDALRRCMLSDSSQPPSLIGRRRNRSIATISDRLPPRVFRWRTGPPP